MVMIKRREGLLELFVAHDDSSGSGIQSRIALLLIKMKMHWPPGLFDFDLRMQATGALETSDSLLESCMRRYKISSSLSMLIL